MLESNMTERRRRNARDWEEWTAPEIEQKHTRGGKNCWRCNYKPRGKNYLDVSDEKDPMDRAKL